MKVFSLCNQTKYASKGGKFSVRSKPGRRGNTPPPPREGRQAVTSFPLLALNPFLPTTFHLGPAQCLRQQGLGHVSPVPALHELKFSEQMNQWVGDNGNLRTPGPPAALREGTSLQQSSSKS